MSNIFHLILSHKMVFHRIDSLKWIVLDIFLSIPAPCTFLLSRNSNKKVKRERERKEPNKVPEKEA